MARSLSANYNMTEADIIAEALEIVQAYGAGETVASVDTTSVDRTLNMLIKRLAAAPQLAERRGVAFVFLEGGVDEYSLGNAASDAAASESYVTTLVNGALTASSTTIVVDDTTGMTAEDKIGFTLSDETIEWQTIDSVTNSTTLVLTTGLSNAVANDARVFTYTTKIFRPLLIFDINFRQYASGAITFNDMPGNKLAHKDFWNLGTKNQDAPPSAIMYDRQKTSGILRLWPGNDTTNNLAIITYLRPAQDFDATTNDADFEQHCYLALVHQLAYYIAPKFGVVGPQRQEIKVDATELWNEVLGFDADNDSLILFPAMEGYG
jgi:hypothetical protein